MWLLQIMSRLMGDKSPASAASEGVTSNICCLVYQKTQKEAFLEVNAVLQSCSATSIFEDRMTSGVASEVTEMKCQRRIVFVILKVELP